MKFIVLVTLFINLSYSEEVKRDILMVDYSKKPVEYKILNEDQRQKFEKIMLNARQMGNEIIVTEKLDTPIGNIASIKPSIQMFRIMEPVNLDELLKDKRAITKIKNDYLMSIFSNGDIWVQSDAWKPKSYWIKSYYK